MQVVKILNIPRQATEKMLLRMLNRKIKDFKIDKLVLEQDKAQKGNLGTAWISSNDQYTVKQLIKLHYHVSNSFLYIIF